MLSLQLKSGEYFTIGGNIVVQVFHDSSTFRVLVKAPREIPILRGNVSERDGNKRPDSLLDKRPENAYEKARNAKRIETLREKSAQREAQRKAEQEKEAAVQDTLQELLQLLERVGQTGDSDAQKEVMAMRSRLNRLAANG